MTGADGVDGAHAPGPTIARPGSIGSRGSGMPSARHSCSTILDISVASCARVGGVVLGRVGDAEAPAEVHLGHRHAELVGHPGVQREHPPGRDLEAGGVEDLAADVGVQAEQLDARARPAPAVLPRTRRRR